MIAISHQELRKKAQEHLGQLGRDWAMQCTEEFPVLVSIETKITTETRVHFGPQVCKTIRESDTDTVPVGWTTQARAELPKKPLPQIQPT